MPSPCTNNASRKSEQVRSYQTTCGIVASVWLLSSTKQSSESNANIASHTGLRRLIWNIPGGRFGSPCCCRSDTRRGRGLHNTLSPQQAPGNRYKATLSRALQLAVRDGHLSRNVARLVVAKKENNTRERYLSAGWSGKTVGNGYQQAVPVIPACVHNRPAVQGVRQSEQFTMTWSMVDLEQRKIRLPETENGKPHTVHLNQTAYDALQSLPRCPSCCRLQD